MRTRQVFLLAPAKQGVRSLALGVSLAWLPALSVRLLDICIAFYSPA
jgi:hypothetical protein